MATIYFSLYLVFIIIVSLAVGSLVARLKLPSPRLLISLIIIFIASPMIIGYFYLAYFNSLPETEVPNVVGLNFDAAKEKLEAADLKPRLAGNINEINYPEGTVVSQRPEGGRIVKAGRVVNLIQSAGKKKVRTPNLLGRPIAQAEAVLLAGELRIGEVKKERNSSLADGTILAQEPLPGEETEMENKVDLIVSTTLEVVEEE